MMETPWISYAGQIVTDPSYVRRIRLGFLIAAITVALGLFQSIRMNSQYLLVMVHAYLSSGASSGISSWIVSFSKPLSLVTGILYVVGMLISIWLLTARPKEDNEGFSPNLSWILRVVVSIQVAFRIVGMVHARFIPCVLSADPHRLLFVVSIIAGNRGGKNFESIEHEGHADGVLCPDRLEHFEWCVGLCSLPLVLESCD